MRAEKRLFLVIPCYNEEEVLTETVKRLTDKLERMMAKGLVSSDSRMLFVNDGSKDRTWQMLQQAHKENPLVAAVHLSRNKGHQNALLAGLMTALPHCDLTISLDADLQDDLEVLDQFVDAYHNGCDVVYGVRNSRQTDTAFKRNTALAFYKVMELFGAEVIYNHADYRLMSKAALAALSEFREVNLFLRGIVPLVGFQSTTVTYDRGERFAGESKYPLKKMLAFAMEGITSFSIKPIRMITALGVCIFLASLVMLVYSVIVWILQQTEPGWSSLIVSVWAIGGLQLLSIGVIGEYIGKIYLETKARPRYIIETVLLD